MEELVRDLFRDGEIVTGWVMLTGFFQFLINSYVMKNLIRDS